MTPDDPPAPPRDDAFIDALARGAFAGGPPSAEAPPPEPGASAVDVARLIAWQAGELPPAEAGAVEAALVDDPEGRAVAAELSAPVPPFLDAWARRQLPSSRRRWVRRAAPVLVALAAAALFFVLRPTGPDPGLAPDYAIVAIRGTHQVVRGEGPAPERRAIDAEGVLTVALGPADAQSGPPPPARAFVIESDALRLAPADALVAGEGGALRLKAPARALFGEGYGPRRLLIAVGADGSTLDAFAGRTESEARAASSAVRWLVVEVVYEAAP